jgi:hypothetical protein
MIEEALQANGDSVEGSDLADQKPKPRMILEAMTDEELSRIWGVLYQVPYQLTVAYRVGPIFLESEVDVEPREPVQDVKFDYQDVDDET